MNEYIWTNEDLYDFQKLLETLHGALPKMSMIASDFSYLPDVKVPGERAPLVSTKVYYIFSLIKQKSK